MMTPSECQAARAPLEWSQMQLTEASRAGIAAIRDFETGRSSPATAKVAEMKSTLRNSGSEFIFEMSGGGSIAADYAKRFAERQYKEFDKLRKEERIREVDQRIAALAKEAKALPKNAQ